MISQHIRKNNCFLKLNFKIYTNISEFHWNFRLVEIFLARWKFGKICAPDAGESGEEGKVDSPLDSDQNNFFEKFSIFWSPIFQKMAKPQKKIFNGKKFPKSIFSF